MFWPPTARIRPSTAPAARYQRADGMDACAVQVLVTGSYASTVATAPPGPLARAPPTE